MMFRRSSQHRFLHTSCYLFLAWLLSLGSAQAWGPHAEITQAALDTLATNDALVLHLGYQAKRLTNYCWIGDYHRAVFEEGSELFYADDYLLFPGAAPQWEHTGPWLKTTFAPCFKRALQALRTETPANAARWIAALVHYVEDAGAPPHALGMKGSPVHLRMETWLQTNAINIADYRPQLLGDTDEKALAGFLKRMEAVNEFAVTRGKKLRLQVELGNRSGARPVILECALESSRAAADLLYTLGKLLPGSPAPSATLIGTVSSPTPPGLERFPAKVVFEGTNISTLAELNGRFEFNYMPTGTYQVIALCPGGGLARTTVELAAGRTNFCKLVPAQKPINLLRNGDFKLNWASSKTPDCWYQVRSAWEGEFIPLKQGQRYRLAANFKKDATGTILVRCAPPIVRALPLYMLSPKLQTRTLSQSDPKLLFTASKDFGVMQVILKSATPPATLLDSIVLEPIEEEKPPSAP